MGKTKKGGADKAATTKGSESLATKKAARKAQSERDHAAAKAAGDVRPKTPHRCKKCKRPSAAVRNGESDLCNRCDRAPKVKDAPQIVEQGYTLISPDAAAILRQAVTA